MRIIHALILMLFCLLPTGMVHADLNASYYDQNGTRGAYFTGNVINVVDANINFNWGGGAPRSGIGSDDFSVRWEGELAVPADGSYQFRIRGDDGIRIYIDGNLLINDWSNHGPRNRDSSAINLQTGQRYSIIVEHYERGGGAVAVVSWNGPTTGGWQVIPASNLFIDNNPPQVTSASYGCSGDSVSVSFDKSLEPVSAATASNYTLDNGATVLSATLDSTGNSVTLETSPLSAASYQLTINNVEDSGGIPVAANTTATVGFEVNGLLGTYYDQDNIARAYFTGSQVERLDATVNFNFGGSAPLSGIGSDRFSVRWQGFVVPDSSDNYQFRTRTDDGVRLYIDGALVIDRWVDQGPTNRDSAAIALNAGQQYEIVMEYYENGGGAVAQLLWSNSSFSWQIIPTNNLIGLCGTPPELEAASFACGRDSISLRFNEQLEQSSAEDIANYSIDNNVSISSAILEADGRTVTLATSMLRRRDHTVIINNVEDNAGTSIADNSTIGAALAVSGLTASYYDQNGQSRSYFTGTEIVDTPSVIDNDWGRSSPITGIGNDNFSVRWTGTLLAPANGDYTFRMRTDDGSRLYLDGVEIIDFWSDHGAAYRSSSAITLQAGQTYSLRMEYYEAGGNAVAQLEWSGPGIAMDIIAAEYFVSSCAIDPVAQWQMEEAFWDNLSNDVIDATGNGNNGRAYNGASTVVSDCNYGIFDGVDDYVQIPHNDDLNGQQELTYMAWVRADSWTGVDQIMAKSVHGGGSGRAQMGIFSESGRLKLRAETINGRREITTDLTLVAGDWNHVAAVFSGDSLRLYIDGVQQAATTFADTSLRQTTDPLNISKRVGTNTYYFDGLMDDVRVYTEALTVDEINDIIANTTICTIGSSFDHYDIDVSGTGLTCEPVTVTITAHDGSDAAVEPGSGTLISLSTSTDTGRWLNASTGTLANNSNSTGTASYTFDTNSSVTLEFYQATAVNALNFNINELSSPQEDAAEDPNIDFVDIGLRFIDATGSMIPTQISGRPSDPLFIQAVRTDTVTGECVAVFAAGTTVDLEMGAACIDPATCDNTVVSIDYVNSGAADSSNLSTVDSAAAPNYGTPVAIEFGANSSAPFSLNYADAGEMHLYARYQVVDGVGAGIGEYINGSSNDFVVRPAGLCVEAEELAGITTCDPLEADCNVYATVGDAFDLTVTAVTWESDADTDFCDGANDVTTNFQLANIALSSLVTLPAGGNSGALSTNRIDITSGGSASVSTSIDQVGAFQFTASPPNYLGEPIAASSTGNIGRFIPHHYVLVSSGSVVTPADQTGATAYTYMGQQFDVEYLLRAVDAAGIRMENFRFENNNLDIDTAASYFAVEGTTTSLNDRISAGMANVEWGDGNPLTAEFGEVSIDLSLTISRQLTVAGAPDGPFSAVDIGLLVGDVDGVSFETTAFDLDTDLATPVVFDSINLGSLGELRYGRVFIPPLYSPEIPTGSAGAIAIPFVTEYFGSDGQFVVNRDDNTTVYDGWGITCSGGLCGSVTTTQATAPATVIQGRSDRSDLSRSPTITRPGSDGSLTIEFDVDDWLQYEWDTVIDYNDDPTTLVTFGRYRGHDRIIYRREMSE